MCIEPRPRLGDHLGTKGAICERSLARSNLGKARIDSREDLAHLLMNVFEHRARSRFLFGLGENVAGGVRLDCPASEFARGDALAPAHLAELLHALARHQILLAHEILGFCGHTNLPIARPMPSYRKSYTYTITYTTNSDAFAPKVDPGSLTAKRRASTGP